MKASVALLTGVLLVVSGAPSVYAGRLIDERIGALATLNATTPAGVFDVLPTDKTVREVLKRWAESNGWIFRDEHWTLGADLPVQAGAGALGTDFRSAVRQLLKSTELTNLPGQPCFYSNRVLRVIAANGVCQPGGLDAAAGMDVSSPYQETIVDRRVRIESQSLLQNFGDSPGPLGGGEAAPAAASMNGVPVPVRRHMGNTMNTGNAVGNPFEARNRLGQ